MRLHLLLNIFTNIAQRVYIFLDCIKHDFNILKFNFLGPLLVLHFIEVWILPLLVLVIVLLKSWEVTVQNIQLRAHSVDALTFCDQSINFFEIRFRFGFQFRKLKLGLERDFFRSLRFGQSRFYELHDLTLKLCFKLKDTDIDHFHEHWLWNFDFFHFY